MEPYFLTFAPKDKVKISYAASIGLSGLRENEKTKFKEWLSAYTAISVREKQGKALLESFSGLEVEQVPDPALLLDAEDWKKWAEYPATNEPYILLFTLSYSPEMVEYGKRLAQEAGMKLIVLGMIQPDCQGWELPARHGCRSAGVFGLYSQSQDGDYRFFSWYGILHHYRCK